MNDRDEYKVLLLEDSTNDFRLIARQLRGLNADFEIDRAETLSDAIDKLMSSSYDVILSDLTVPDSEGLATIAKIRAVSRETPIIVLTGLEDEILEAETLRVGAQNYLVKDELSGHALSRAIVHAVRRQRSQLAVISLISELEESHSLLQQKNKRLKELYRTAHEFVDNVSHDLRTPLTVIKDFVSIIREGMVGDINDEQRTMLDKVAVRADDLNIMVDDLLDASKMESGLLGAWRRQVPVERILSQVKCVIGQRAVIRNVELIVDCDDDVPDVYCDSEKVQRIITNLAVNAIKFSGENSCVRVWAQADPVNHQVQFGVTDNGPGIGKESLDEMFQRFRQLKSRSKSAGKGYGLGLSIAQQLCQLNLTELDVVSRLGEGTTFSFTLPVMHPREILRRWLTSANAMSNPLRCVEITLDESVEEIGANEFDSFLNCHLRSNDLLMRLSVRRWALLVSAPRIEADQWQERTIREFEKENRNRPHGRLPMFRCRTLADWSKAGADAIVDEFSAIALAQPELLQTI